MLLSCRLVQTLRHSHEQPDQEGGEDDPHGDEHGCSHAAYRSLRGFCGGFSVLVHYLWRDKPHHQHDPEWNDDQVIKVSKHRNEVGDQVDGRDGIGRDNHSKYLGEPRCACIAGGKPYRVHVPFDESRPLFGVRD